VCCMWRVAVGSLRAGGGRTSNDTGGSFGELFVAYEALGVEFLSFFVGKADACHVAMVGSGGDGSGRGWVH